MNNWKMAVALTTALILSASCVGRDENVDMDIFEDWNTNVPINMAITPTNESDEPTTTFNEIDDDGFDPAPTATTSLLLEDALSQGVAMQHERIALTDTQLGCEAIRSVVPSGWQSGGQVTWNMQSGDAPAVILFFATSPDERSQAGYISNMAYDDPDPSKGFAEGQYDDNWLPKPVKRLQTPETYMQEFLGRLFGVSDMSISNVRQPEGEQAVAIENLRQQMQSQLDALSEANASSQYAQSSSKIGIDVAEVDMSYAKDGVNYKVRASCMLIANINTLTTQDLYNTYTFVNTFWNVGEVRYYLAEADVFEDETYLVGGNSFLDNLIINEQWLNAIQQTSRSIFQQNADIAYKDFQVIQAQLQQQAQQIAASSSQNYSSSSGGGSSSGGYSSSVMNGATNAITGNSYYEAPDGGSVLLDYNDYHYTDGSSIYSSSTPLNIGGTNLSELTDLGTMGGG